MYLFIYLFILISLPMAIVIPLCFHVSFLTNTCHLIIYINNNEKLLFSGNFTLTLKCCLLDLSLSLMSREVCFQGIPQLLFLNFILDITIYDE